MQHAHKICLLLLTCLLSSGVFAQLLDGDLMDENRKLVSQTDFKLEGYKTGYFILELSVNREGRVTATTVNYEESTLNATPLQIKAQNYAKTLRFEPGTYYPEFHHVRIKVNFVKP